MLVETAVSDELPFADQSMIVGQLRGLYTSEPMSWDFFGTKGHLPMNSDGRFARDPKLL